MSKKQQYYLNDITFCLINLNRVSCEITTEMELLKNSFRADFHTERVIGTRGKYIYKILTYEETISLLNKSIYLYKKLFNIQKNQVYKVIDITKNIEIDRITNYIENKSNLNNSNVINWTSPTTSFVLCDLNKEIAAWKKIFVTILNHL